MNFIKKVKINIETKALEYKKILLTKFEQYKILFDKRLNTTITIGIIGVILLLAGSLFYSGKINLKTNLFESSHKNQITNILPEDLLESKQAIIIIGGEKYLLKLEKLDNINELKY